MITVLFALIDLSCIKIRFIIIIIIIIIITFAGIKWLKQATLYLLGHH